MTKFVRYAIVSLAALFSNAINANPTTGGKAFSDAVNGIAATTPNLKQQVLQSNNLENLADGYDTAPFFGQVLINISDTLNVSVTFTMALFWVMGFFMVIFSWIALKEAIDDDNDRRSGNYRKKFSIGGIVLGVVLMSFNIAVMTLADTAGIGQQVNNTYNFRNENVEKGRQSFIGERGGNVHIDPTTGEVTVR